LMYFNLHFLRYLRVIAGARTLFSSGSVGFFLFLPI
jgi:hypothetical protein